MTLTHRQRLQACLTDDSALDRPPVALWRHFPVDDQDPETLAAATLDFQRHYDFDLVKVTPASSYSIKDWGAEDVWEGHPEGTRRYTRQVIVKPQDWEHLPVLSPSSPHLARQLACLRIIRAALTPDTPLLQTIFSPLAQAKNLAGGERLIVHLRLSSGSCVERTRYHRTDHSPLCRKLARKWDWTVFFMPSSTRRLVCSPLTSTKFSGSPMTLSASNR